MLPAFALAVRFTVNWSSAGVLPPRGRRGAAGRGCSCRPGDRRGRGLLLVLLAGDARQQVAHVGRSFSTGMRPSSGELRFEPLAQLAVGEHRGQQVRGADLVRALFERPEHPRLADGVEDVVAENARAGCCRS